MIPFDLCHRHQPLGRLWISCGCFVRVSCWNTLQVCIPCPVPAPSLNGSCPEGVQSKGDLLPNSPLPFTGFVVSGKALSFPVTLSGSGAYRDDLLRLLKKGIGDRESEDNLSWASDIWSVLSALELFLLRMRLNPPDAASFPPGQATSQCLPLGPPFCLPYSRWCE